MHNTTMNDSKCFKTVAHRRVFVSLDFFLLLYAFAYTKSTAIKVPLWTRRYSVWEGTEPPPTFPLEVANLLWVWRQGGSFPFGFYGVRNRWSQRLCLPLSLSFDMQIKSSQRMTDALVRLSRATGLSKHRPWWTEGWRAMRRRPRIDPFLTPRGSSGEKSFGQINNHL